MACSGGCGGSSQQVPFQARRESQMEFKVLLPDGTYSEAQPSLEAAFALAAETGGQARSMAKTT